MKQGDLIIISYEGRVPRFANDYYNVPCVILSVMRNPYETLVKSLFHDGSVRRFWIVKEDRIKIIASIDDACL